MDSETLRLFDAYLKRDLNEAARNGFESRLSADSEFRKEFGEFISMVEGISAYERERLKALLMEPRWTLRGRRLWVRLAAAVIGLLLLLIPAYIIYRSATFADRIVDEFYIKDTGLPLVMSVSENPELGKAMVEYKDANYAACLGILETLLKENADNDTLNYYAGICCFELKEMVKSQSYFQMVGTAVSIYYYPSLYNLALIRIAGNETDEARKLLVKVMSGAETPLKQKAENLLRNL